MRIADGKQLHFRSWWVIISLVNYDVFMKTVSRIAHGNEIRDEGAVCAIFASRRYIFYAKSAEKKREFRNFAA